MKTITESIETLLNSFNKKYTDEYKNNLRNYMVHDLRLHADIIEVLCIKLSEECKTFPIRAQIKKAAWEIKKNMGTKSRNTTNYPAVESIKEEVYPPHLLAVLDMVKQGKTEDGPFPKALKRLGFSIEEIYEIFNAREIGEVHPLVLKWKEEREII